MVPVLRKNRQSSSPNKTTASTPTKVSFGLKACPKANTPDVTNAAGQKPIPDASVYWIYPRSENSSNSPTKTNAIPQAPIEDKIALPWSAKPVILNPCSRNMTNNVPLIPENPHKIPTQKSFLNARFNGKPYVLNLRCSILPMIKVGMQRSKNAIASTQPIKNGVTVSSAACFRASRKPWSPPLWMRTKAPRTATSSTTKISKRQPARMPFGPMKIDFTPGDVLPCTREISVEARGALFAAFS